MKSQIVALALLALLSVGLNPAQAEVWTAENVWSAEFEDAYRDWVRDHFNKDIYMNDVDADGSPNPLFGLRPDCADTVYSARILFAFKNKLPVAFNDPTGGSIYVSNKMSRWDKTLDQTDRLRKFLNYVYDNMGTHNLRLDTFPLPISAKFIRPGAVLVTVKKNHHSWTLKNVNEAGIPYFVYSTVGRSAKGDPQLLLDRETWPMASWVFEGNHTVTSGAGFRFWRNEEDLTKSVLEVPNSSDEQFRVPLRSWITSIQKIIAVRDETKRAKLDRLTSAACKYLEFRAKAVKESDKFMTNNIFACIDEKTYDDFSTPGRDRQWFIDILNLRIGYQDWKLSTEYDPNDAINSKLAKVFPFTELTAEEENTLMQEQVVDDDSICSIEYDTDQTLDLAEAKRRLLNNQLSNNPLDKLAVRWGSEARLETDAAATCPSWQPWAPNYNESLY